jgi:hypothetical protein
MANSMALAPPLARLKRLKNSMVRGKRSMTRSFGSFRVAAVWARAGGAVYTVRPAEIPRKYSLEKANSGREVNQLITTRIEHYRSTLRELHKNLFMLLAHLYGLFTSER